MSEVFAKQQNTIAQNILELIKAHPSVKFDYRKLIQYYWYYIDGTKVYIPLEVMEKLTQPESIGRAYRKLIEDGLIILPKDFKASRGAQEKQFHSFYGKKKGNA